jgi:Flp pilus assembly CpaE family ATPase
VLECARSVVDFVVVDCGFCLERDEELAYDTAAPRRNGATLASLEAARIVVAVAGADPVGLARFVRARADLMDVLPHGELLTVINRVRRGVVGAGDPREEIAAALSRYAAITSIASIPDDAAAFDAAMVDGRLLCEVAPGSPARKAIRDLAVRIIDEPKRRRRGVLAALRGAG